MTYKAQQGDIIWINLDPQTGHDQRGRRPAMVVSNTLFNDYAKPMAMLCPITNTDRGLPIQVKLDNRTKTSGTIMCDQAKILDMAQRKAEFIEKAPEDIVFEVTDIISGIVEIEGM